MMKTFRFLLAGVAAAAMVAAPGCATFLPPPDVEIVDAALVSLGFTSGTVAVTLEVTNQSSRTLTIQGFTYHLSVKSSSGSEEASGGEWAELAGGFNERELTLPGKAAEQVTIPVSFEYRALGAALRSFLEHGDVPYRISGSVSVRGLGMTFDVPFRAEGALGYGSPVQEGLGAGQGFLPS